MSNAMRCLAALAGLIWLAGTGQARADAGRWPDSVRQGGLVVGWVEPGSRVEYAGRRLRVGEDGVVLVGAGRDAASPLHIRVFAPDGGETTVTVEVEATVWREERVEGVPPATVEPPPEIAARIAREQAAVAAARVRDDPRQDFASGLRWPLQGRLSGHFGAVRSYNGKPGTPHSGTDIAAATGTPVRAPAAGVVSFAQPDLYLTGGTLVLDHGHGLSSVFLHLSRIDVRPGQRIQQGEPIALVGATGRASGPHLHWGMNWFEVRLDPEQLLTTSFTTR